MRISDPDDFDGMPVDRALRIVNWLMVVWFTFGAGLLGLLLWFLLSGDSDAAK